MDIEFPEHKCGLFLEHNVYRDYYTPIDKAVEEEEHWVSPEEKQRALETGDIWTLQWYPNTPIGFFRLTASTLEAVLAGVKDCKR